MPWGRRVDLFVLRFGRLTQRLECHPHTVEVAGSNPAPPMRFGSDTQIAVNRRQR
jgi:hypothetical protein